MTLAQAGLLLLGVAGAASALQGGVEPAAPPLSEGPLNNDVFVPMSEPAAEALAQGDASLARARTLEPAGAETARLLDAACDQWQRALRAGAGGSSVWLEPGPESERRLVEGVHAAVLRRLAALRGQELERWRARIAPAAELALAELDASLAPDARRTALAEVVRLFPLTPAAARSALILGDLALEAGLRDLARGWYARSELEGELSAASDLLRALAPRRAALPTPSVRREAWETARSCTFVDALVFRREGTPTPSDRRPRPGGTLSEHLLAVQTPSEFLLVTLQPTGQLQLDGRLRLTDLVPGTSPDLGLEAIAWPLLPLFDGDSWVLVHGRSQPGEPNLLVALDPPAAGTVGFGLEIGRIRPPATLRWALLGSELHRADGSVLPVPELEELGDLEFQPGPALSADAIVVQVRETEGQTRAWLVALDRRDGGYLWKRQLAAGADRVVTPRFSASQRRAAAQPLLALEVEGEPRVFAGTHLGLGVLLDPLLGEPLWGFKNRRRDEEAPGWRGERPLLGSGGGETTVILWAPMDSDRLYTLDPGPLAGPAASSGVALRAPLPLDGADALLGGAADEVVVTGNAGKDRTISVRRPGRDRLDALDIGPDERFVGRGLLGAERAWVATDRGLYLFDRTRELYLLDFDPLPPAGGRPDGGDVLARGEHVVVVGATTVWSFRAR